MEWIREPANENDKGLENACTMIWNSVMKGNIKLVKNIYEIWLIVGYAVIPLISLIHIALNKDHNNEDKTNMTNMNRYRFGLSINNIIIDSLWTPKYTPAITIVGLCEGAGIGVGADIAFNDQEGEGDWADLVR